MYVKNDLIKEEFKEISKGMEVKGKKIEKERGL